MVGYPNGATLAMIFDSRFNQLVSRTNQAGNLTTYDLDSRGNAELRTEHNTSGPDRKTHYTYTAPPTGISGMPGGLVKEEIAAYLSDDAVTTETIYHTTGLQIGLPHWIKIAKGTDVEGTITRTYDANRNLVQSIDVFGAVTVYLFDGMNRLKTQTLPDPGTGQHAAPVLTNLYDAAGNRKAVIDPRSGRTDYQHHWRGGISNQLLPDVGDGRHETAYHYDPNGNLEREEDKSLTRETTHTYNERNQRVKTLEPLPQDPNANHGRPEYIFKVDTLGNVKAARDPRLNWTYTSYDALSRPFQVQLPATSQHAASTTTRFYDGLGRVTQVIKPGLSGGIAQTNHVYDSLGRRVSTTLPADSNGRRATSKYDYDLRDNLVEATNAKGQRAVFDYDERNRQTDAGSPGADAATIEQIYDDATRTIETVVSSGDPATEREIQLSHQELIANPTEESFDLALRRGVANGRMTKNAADTGANQRDLPTAVDRAVVDQQLLGNAPFVEREANRADHRVGVFVQEELAVAKHATGVVDEGDQLDLSPLHMRPEHRVSLPQLIGVLHAERESAIGVLPACTVEDYIPAALHGRRFPVPAPGRTETSARRSETRHHWTTSEMSARRSATVYRGCSSPSHQTVCIPRATDRLRETGSAGYGSLRRFPPGTSVGESA